MRRTFYPINWQIRALQVRLLDEEGKQIGVLPTSEARALAEKRGLDLVEIAQGANPPIAKIIDYAKFKYQQAKKEKEAKRKNKKGDKLKEIRLTPFIGEADLETRINRARKFAKKGDRIKVVVKFLGRQITQKDFGYQLIEKVKEKLKGVYQEDVKPRLSGRELIIFMKPIKNHGEVDEKSEEKQKQDQKVSRQSLSGNANG